MTSIPKFQYKLRPGYSSRELLLDFEVPESANDLQKELFSILEKAGFLLLEVKDTFVFDEFLFEFSSPNGSILLSRDHWDLFFILGTENQTDILNIDQLLQDHGDFKKLDVDFGMYK